MASLSTIKSGGRAGARRILFLDADGRRHSIYLGRMPEDTAKHILVRIDSILACRVAGESLPRDLAAWVNSLADAFHEKLAKVGLVETRTSAAKRTVADLLDTFLARAHVKPSTRKAYKQTIDSLRSYLGNTMPLEAVTTERADEWRSHIATETEGTTKKRGTTDNRLSPATVAKRVFVARAVFRRAVRWGWLSKSPFDGVKAGSQANPDRAFYVTPEATVAILSKCPSIDWKLVVGLCRYAGLRCPSELVSLTWNDVLWDAGRLVVRPTKTAGHEGHEVRVVPICPELKSILEQAFEAAPDGSKAVVPMLRTSAANLRTTFAKIITRAGMSPWPRLFQNLRASRATDWAEAYPAHVVAKWLGHSPAVAAQHYLQVRDQHFEAVIAGGGRHVARQGAHDGAHEGAQQDPALDRTASLESLEVAIESALTSHGVAPGGILNNLPVGDIGLERLAGRAAETPGKQGRTSRGRRGSGPCSAPGGARAPGLVAAAWSLMPDDVRLRILAITAAAVAAPRPRATRSG